MRNRCAIHIAAMLMALAAASAGAAAAGQTIRPGDNVLVAFTCLTPEGEVAAATSDDAPGNGGRPRSPIFVAKAEPGPVVVTAGGQEAPPEAGPAGTSFEGEILSRIGKEIVGWTEGERKTVRLSAERRSVSGPGDGLLPMARIRVRPKERTFPRQAFVASSQREPRIGDDYPIDPLLHGIVAAVTDNDVTVRCSDPDGKRIPTPFGMGTLHVREDRLEIEIDARRGALVRTGPIVGRIADVTDREFRIDFGHPFGGETLACDVAVEKTAGAEGGGR